MDPTFYASYFRHETTHWWFRWRFDLISNVLSSLGNGKPLRILDAGCGTGQMLKCLEAHGDAIGLDTSSQAIGYARERGVKRLVQGSITAPPFRAGSFDCVVSLDVIEHVDDDIGILKKLHEVVKPGGFLVITVPAFKTLWSEHDEINQHKRRYRANELSELITDAGFDIQRVTYCNTALFLPVLATRKGKNLLRSLRKSRRANPDALESDLIEYPGPINTALYWLLRAETKLMQHTNLPFGVSILAVAQRPLATEPVVANSAKIHVPVRENGHVPPRRQPVGSGASLNGVIAASDVANEVVVR